MKLVRIAVIIILIAIVGVFIGLQVAPSLVSSSLSKKMGVDVSIGSIGASSDEVKVQYVSIANPAGSKLPKAFSVDKIAVDSPLTNYVKDPIIIDEITLDNVYLSIEAASPTGGLSGNWGKIIDNLNKSSPPAAKSDKKGTQVTIKKLILTNINVDLVTLLQAGSVQRLPTIPRLEFTNISSDSGMPIEPIISAILAAVLKNNGIESILENVIKGPKGLFDTLITPFK